VKRQVPSTWPGDAVAFESDAEGQQEVWLNPRLPPLARRALHPLRVEIVCWCAARAEVDDALALVLHAFGGDSVLAAIVRQDAMCRLFVYTACSKAIAQARYRSVRAALRPTAISLQVSTEPTWQSLPDTIEALRGLLGSAG
jgi:hypothetical protein